MYTSPQMIIHWKQSVLILFFYCVIKISPHYEMISKTEPCLVVSIQNQLTLCIGTVIVRQIPVAQKLKLLFGDYAVHVLWISSSLWIICLNYLKSWHGLYGVADSTQKKKNIYNK